MGGRGARGRPETPAGLREGGRERRRAGGAAAARRGRGGRGGRKGRVAEAAPTAAAAAALPPVRVNGARRPRAGAGRREGGQEGASSGEAAAAAPRGALLSAASGGGGRPPAQRPRAIVLRGWRRGRAGHRGETLVPARPSGQGKRNRACLGRRAVSRRPGDAPERRGG